jgi:hypothetical protein
MRSSEFFRVPNKKVAPGGIVLMGVGSGLV